MTTNAINKGLLDIVIYGGYEETLARIMKIKIRLSE